MYSSSDVLKFEEFKLYKKFKKILSKNFDRINSVL